MKLNGGDDEGFAKKKERENPRKKDLINKNFGDADHRDQMNGSEPTKRSTQSQANISLQAMQTSN